VAIATGGKAPHLARNPLLALLSQFLHSACLPALNGHAATKSPASALCRQAAFALKTCHPELVSGSPPLGI